MNTPSDLDEREHVYQNSPTTRLPLVLRIRRWGWLLLLVGWSFAAVIYINAASDSAIESTESIVGGRSYDYNIERIGGKAALYAARFNEWLGGLWHGRTLSYTVAVLTLVLAIACFWVASLISEPMPDETDRDHLP
jgi:hypothetical protein